MAVLRSGPVPLPLVSPPPPDCPKSLQFREQSAFCATLAGVEAAVGVLFGQAPPVHNPEIPVPPHIGQAHPGIGNAAFRRLAVIFPGNVAGVAFRGNIRI